MSMPFLSGRSRCCQIAVYITIFLKSSGKFILKRWNLDSGNAINFTQSRSRIKMMRLRNTVNYWHTFLLSNEIVALKFNIKKAKCSEV
jgi:hypothetical protein